MLGTSFETASWRIHPPSAENATGSLSSVRSYLWDPRATVRVASQYVNTYSVSANHIACCIPQKAPFLLRLPIKCFLLNIGYRAFDVGNYRRNVCKSIHRHKWRGINFRCPLIVCTRAGASFCNGCHIVRVRIP